MTKEKVNVVIPLYQKELDENEQISLNQCLRILRDYPITIIKPKHLNINTLLKAHPQLKVESFAKPYFDGVYGYNLLMLSSELYERFRSFEYILIYQLDAFVFRNELDLWSKKGYDYIGAPWVIKPKYNRPHYKAFLIFQSLLYKVLNRPQVMGRVGNGGFSLRKVEKFYQTTVSKKVLIEKYIEGCKAKNIFNEDVFWGTENPEFTYPDYEEALQFSFDHHPRICMEQAHGQLPFGCHGWSKEKNIGFWKEIIHKHIE